jgi:hypothetical protein
LVDRFLRLGCLTYRSRPRPRSLLSRDAVLTGRNGGPHDWPPLLYAAFSRIDTAQAGHSKLEVARLLLAAGADPSASYLIDSEPPPATTLSAAFHGRHHPTNQPAHRHSLAPAQLLRDAGADPNDERAVGNACGYRTTTPAWCCCSSTGSAASRPRLWRARLGRQEFTPATLVQDELRYAAEMDLDRPGTAAAAPRRSIGIDINRAVLVLFTAGRPGVDGWFPRLERRAVGNRA